MCFLSGSHGPEIPLSGPPHHLPSDTSPHPAYNTGSLHTPGGLELQKEGRPRVLAGEWLVGSQQGHPTKGLPTLVPLLSLPGHADFLHTRTLEEEICLVLKGREEWLDQEPPGFGDGRLPGSVIHVYDNNTEGTEAVQRQEGTGGGAGERAMAKELWVLEESREQGQSRVSRNQGNG